MDISRYCQHSSSTTQSCFVTVPLIIFWLALSHWSIRLSSILRGNEAIKGGNTYEVRNKAYCYQHHLCALTLVVFLAFYNRLPASIPVHFDSAGVANSFWPRNVVVFGVPVACVLLNLISGFTVSQKENAKPYMYYIMAVVAFVATGIMIYLGMK